ncbi:MAG TPA: sulfatase-like hydrolase/transferase [archaeon]|nr:sulfatase-like hydrolase/transferase [archaeon]
MKPQHRLNRRDFLRISCSGLVSAGFLMPRETFAAGKKPNFIIFYTDDQGIGDLSCYGAADLPTPNIDALAGSGVRFTNWYSASPVCSPSRSALLTGRYPQRTGVNRILTASRSSPGLYKDEITIPKALQKLGYRTGVFGKWHLGSTPESRPNAQGFDQFYGFLSGCIDYYSHIMYWEMGSGIYPVHDLWKDNQEVWENGTYFTDIITRESVRFIRENSAEPFFLYVAYNSPHYPMHAPPEYFERFKHLEPHRRQQAAMVATVDDSIGKIMGVLKDQGLLENTVIYFQSDNGATIEKRCLHDGSGEYYHGGSNAPFRGFKGGLCEGGIRMPAILSFPGRIPAGTTCSELGCAIDILPTLLRIAGVPLPADRVIDGSDILPMALGNAKTPHKRLYWEIRDQLALREGDWKLILNGRASFEDKDILPEVFLADLAADPEEKNNLAQENQSLAGRLTEICLSMKADVNTNR